MPRFRTHSKRSSADKPPDPGTAPVDRQGGISIKDSEVQVDGDMVGRDKTTIEKQTNIHIEIGQVLPILLLLIVFIGGSVLAFMVGLPGLQPSGPMTGLFNIAFAQFGQLDPQGQVVEWKEGANLSRSIFTSVQNELSAIPGLKDKVQLRNEEVGLVRGATPAERMLAAKQLASQLNAHLLIFGTLQKQTNSASFVPEFYVADIKGAEEIVGLSELGSPITSTAQIILSDKLQARSTALSVFTIGLVYFTAGEYDKALDQFEKATQIGDWKDIEGKQVLYLFIGTTYVRRNQEGDLNLARAAYEKAVTLNPEYARAYIGLGNIFYNEFLKSDPADLTKLDQAAAQYEKALKAEDKPVTAYVDAKVHASLGNVYVAKGDAGQIGAYVQAEREYQQVIDPYEKGSIELGPQAVAAYWGLALIQERWKGNYRQAADFYCKCKIAAEKYDQRVAPQAQAQLQSIEAKLQATIFCGTLTPTP